MLTSGTAHLRTEFFVFQKRTALRTAAYHRSQALQDHLFRTAGKYFQPSAVGSPAAFVPTGSSAGDRRFPLSQTIATVQKLSSALFHSTYGTFNAVFVQVVSSAPRPATGTSLVVRVLARLAVLYQRLELPSLLRRQIRHVRDDEEWPFGFASQVRTREGVLPLTQIAQTVIGHRILAWNGVLKDKETTNRPNEELVFLSMNLISSTNVDIRFNRTERVSFHRCKLLLGLPRLEPPNFDGQP